MTNDGERDPLHDDPVVEWSLHERLGGERPPDLLAGVQARLRAGGPVRPVAARSANAWLAAAVVLLGLGVVFGVALWPEGSRGEVPIAPVQDPSTAEPKLVTVFTLAEIEALPLTTRGVEAQMVDDAEIRALTRLRDLEVLVVREPYNETFGMGLKMTAPAAPRPLTAAAWPHLLSFKKLRRLELSGTVRAGQLDKAQLAGFAEGLESLPLLESLTLRCMDTSDELVAVLAKARSLRRLDLSFNHGFVDEGAAALLACRTLRSLSLRGCQQLQDRVLAPLAALPELEELDLSLIDGINWRNNGAVMSDDDRAIFERARRFADKIGMGPGEATLHALGAAPKLRVLDVSSSHYVTAAGLRELGACRTLRELNVFGVRDHSPDWVAAMPPELERLEVCGEHTDDFCAAVAEHLKHLRHLTIAACYQITDRGLAAVAAMPSLRVLDMRQMRGLTAACIESLLAAKQLEELDVRHCDFVTAKHVARLKRVLPKLRKIETSVEAEAIEQEEKLPEPTKR